MVTSFTWLHQFSSSETCYLNAEVILLCIKLLALLTKCSPFRPGMSSGLDKEQVQLNQLMLSYRNLCHTLNKKRATKVFIGPFFTDMVCLRRMKI